RRRWCDRHRSDVHATRRAHGRAVAVIDIEPSAWPWLVVSALTCVCLLVWLYIDIRREVESWK
ncbi:hypothetical protein, partial [Variovorax sp. Varisp85]|uniref:hypothetical protein n=1 Tax=Variovorax sp. Varisp85 TaxID=3243059 RepID=UPI0039A5ECC1